MAEEPFTPIGRIVRTHGLKGEVSVVIDHDASLDALLGLEVWIVPPTPTIRQTRVSALRPGPKGPLVTLEGVGSIEDARTLCGRDLLARTEDLPEPDTFESSEDLLDFTLIDEVHGPVGTVVDTIVTGANDVWVVQGTYGEVLVPVIPDVVLDIDDERQVISVRLLPGLLPTEDDDES